MDHLSENGRRYCKRSLEEYRDGVQAMQDKEPSHSWFWQNPDLNDRTYVYGSDREQMLDFIKESPVREKKLHPDLTSLWER